MNVKDKPVRSIRYDDKSRQVWVLDQRRLPHEFEELRFDNLDDAVAAISNMTVRGAPLIGVTAAFGMALACLESCGDNELEAAARKLAATRPTAVNLVWATNRMLSSLLALPKEKRLEKAWECAAEIYGEELEMSRQIGVHGAEIIRVLAKRLDRPIRILTHCNAGWLATVDYGTATAPIYEAWGEGIGLEVFADETRPRLQGTLTAWELSEHGIKTTLITDNAGGLLMRKGLVDMVITGADRIARNGDVANKIGTYLKALAAADNSVPFYVAAPSSTFDRKTAGGEDIVIEERCDEEVRWVSGLNREGKPEEVAITGAGVGILNPGFDVTPARLVTAFITESGVFTPAELQKF